MKAVLMRLAALTLALAAITTSAHAYDDFGPRSRPPIVQEQRGSSERPPLQKYELIVKNRSSAPIVAVYAKSLRMSNWSVDLIPSYSIKPGRQGLVNLYDGGGSCDWSIRTRDTDDRESLKTLNVCGTATLTITD